jgi:hypothetical protein
MTGSDCAALVSVSATALITLIFAKAAWHKLADFASFTGFVADYQVVPEAVVTGISMGVVAAEVAVSIALAVPQTRLFGAVLAMAILLGYAGAMAINILRGRHHIDCGCGGEVQPLHWSLVIRNAVLTGIVGLTVSSSASKLSLVETATAIAGGGLLWAVLGLVEQILANAARIRALRVEHIEWTRSPSR